MTRRANPGAIAADGTMDLRKYSVSELEQLISKAQKRKAQIADDRVRRAKTRIDAVLKETGLTLAQIYGAKAPGAAAAPAKAKTKSAPLPPNDKRLRVKPKYRNPDNPGETWAGRGAQPRWMAKALAGGRKLDDLLIG